MCDPFVCFERVRFFTWNLPPDFGYIFILLLVTFSLQWVANIVWTENAQVTRNLFQEAKEKRGTWRSGLLGQSLLYTLLSTLLWIVRITLILESNLWIYLMVLFGNVVGVYWTQSRNKADHQNLANDISSMLKRLGNEKCDSCVRDPIRDTLRLLKLELAKIDTAPTSLEGSSVLLKYY